VAGVVTLLASLREIWEEGLGVGRALEVLQVAGYAGGAGQVVVIVNVAVGAGARRHGVQAGEREPGAVVVELLVCPVGGLVTLLGSLREIRSGVIRIGRALEVLQVAGYAGGAGQVVVIVNVAVGAGARRHGVQAGEREPGAVVVELRVCPVAGVVTLLAGLRE